MSHNNELPPLPEPLDIEWPSLHLQGLSCGIEDRSIHDRYEAAEYGWQQGVDQAAECIPDAVFDADQMQEYALSAIEAQAGHSELVAWQNPETDEVCTAALKSRGLVRHEKFTVPLFTHSAPVRQPLSDDQITEMAHRMATTYTHRTDPTSHAYGFVRHTLINFVRTIEAAHGITAQGDKA